MQPERWRGAIHFHTRTSYDSLSGIESVIGKALRHNLNYLICTDHDTLSGSERLRARVLDRGLPITVPLAAEYCTDLGDVIAAFLSEEITERGFDPFVAEVRRQNGVLLLPHPYDQHKEVERLAAACDLIEVFNARSTPKNNTKAEALADKYKKPHYVSADSHLWFTFGTCVQEFACTGNLQTDLLFSLDRTVDVRALRLSNLDVPISQMIKAWKRRDPRLFAYSGLRLVKRSLRVFKL